MNAQAPPPQEDLRPLVLVAGGSPDTLSSLCTMLPDTCRVIRADSAEQALALASAIPAPAIALLDLGRSGAESRALCRRLKQLPHDPALPVVLLTSDNSAAEVEQALAAGADDCLPPPLCPALLRARIDSLLALGAARTHADSVFAELTALQSRLIQAEKLSGIAGLVAGIAHEISTPVGIAMTAASTLEDRTRKLLSASAAGQLRKSQVAAYLELAGETTRLVTGHCRHAAELIQSFKRMAVDQCSDNRRRLELSQCLGDAVRSLGPELKKTRVTLELDCPPGLMVVTFPGVLTQIVTNLVMNSVIHGFDEGRTNGRITLSATLGPDGQVRLIHADTGRGVPTELAEKIFEPFFTTRRGRGGSGLGLGIVHNLVTEQLGGTIRLENTPGGGASFLIEFSATPNQPGCLP